MRWIGRLLLLACACAAVLFAVANPDPVVVRAVPEGGPLLQWPAVEVPLFLVALAFLLVGIVIGTVGEWLRGRASRRASGR